MALDARKNFAISTIATAPSPATSGTSLVVAAGDGAKFPTPPFNAPIWPAGLSPTTTNAEIVRVTAVSTDTLTIVRNQESSNNRTIIVGDQIMAGLTAKTISDIETMLNNMGTTTIKQSIVPTGAINGANTAFTVPDNYAAGSLEVYLNGQHLYAGSGVDYVEVTNGFTMQYAPATGDILYCNYLLSNTAFIQGSNSILTGEAPTGVVNGTNTVFVTGQAKYIANSLEVTINGLIQIRGTDFTETTPTTGTFTFATAPLTGDIIRCSYQTSTGSSGNADTVDGIHASATPTANQLLALDSTAQVPTAALGAAWTGFTPTVTAGSGSFTTVTAPNCYYKQIGKTVHVMLQVNITTPGTAGGAVRIQLPVAPNLTGGRGLIGYGREDAITGKMLQTVSKNGSDCDIFVYDNTSIAATSGAVVRCSLTYEAA